MITRFGRTPLGVFRRSPLGVFIRSYNLSGNGYNVGERFDNPYDSELDQHAYLFNPLDYVLGQEVAFITEYFRRRFGISYVLRASYSTGTKFTLITYLGNFINSPIPNMYLSNTDDHSLYSNGFKSLQDWELNLDNLVVSGLSTGTVETDIPYATLSPFFGSTISFVLAESDDVDNIVGTKNFKQTAIPVLKVN